MDEKTVFNSKENDQMEKRKSIFLPLGYACFKDFLSKKKANIDILSEYEVMSIRYGEEYVIFVKRHRDGKAFMLSPKDIRKMYTPHSFDGDFDTLLEECMSADDFIISEGEEEASEGLFVYSRIKNQFSYIFQINNELQPKAVLVDSREIIDNSNRTSYLYPLVHYFKTCGKKFVYIIRNDKACIYTIDGDEIGEYDLFVVMDNDIYATIQANGKYNYFSFEKMCVLFDKWFEDCEYPEFVNHEWRFKILDNGKWRIINKCGIDIHMVF